MLRQKFKLFLSFSLTNLLTIPSLRAQKRDYHHPISSVICFAHIFHSLKPQNSLDILSTHWPASRYYEDHCPNCSNILYKCPSQPKRSLVSIHYPVSRLFKPKRLQSSNSPLCRIPHAVWFTLRLLTTNTKLTTKNITFHQLTIHCKIYKDYRL